MTRFGTIIRSVLSSLTTRGSSAVRHSDEPGRFGEAGTVEVDPATIGPVRMTYVPSTDGDPDPGEIVWTWVPFEERDGRGKDRPVLIVAEEPGGARLAVQLTSKHHDDSPDYVPIGSGPWDTRGRSS
ncbi:hypothetical protein L1277_000867 [Okibacterium sp. HSC-33S16]|uniref:type II toxin-antitoxin system PemK/MazF family toxin n=1 Tax=Okibacterium sp. HSC-33S16 TaxID=2910965 RepID=UPI00209EA203|nr:type II toxin-antitoxin system PemK/MazF family toxin [Okibacterium sp. HSC-33S16]MCP2030803.1 hypothetical protein [Okibacterium sp. HSC-33S16]